MDVIENENKLFNKAELINKYPNYEKLQLEIVNIRIINENLINKVKSLEEQNNKKFIEITSDNIFKDIDLINISNEMDYNEIDENQYNLDRTFIKKIITKNKLLKISSKKLTKELKLREINSNL